MACTTSGFRNVNRNGKPNEIVISDKVYLAEGEGRAPGNGEVRLSRASWKRLKNLLVGFLDHERGAGALWSADDFNASAATHYAERGHSGAPPVVTDEDLNKVRDKRRELFARWAALPAGEALELPFP